MNDFQKQMDMWRKIDSYNLPIRVVLGPRGFGKTFPRKYKAIYDFIIKGDRFNYIVETNEMVITLSQNNGEKFFNRIIQYCQKHKSRKTKIILDALKNKTKIQEGTEQEYEIKGHKIKGGAIFINGKTAGYILSMNDFANLKRNDFVDSKRNIIDEFISERMDIRVLQNPYKTVSLIESIIRDEYSIIDMLGNTVRLDDPMLVRMGLSNMKAGEWRIIKNSKKLPIGIAHRVNPFEYQSFMQNKKDSVSGNFADLMKETSLNDNEFKNELTDDLRIPTLQKSTFFLACFHGEFGSIRVHQTKDRNQFYILPDYGDNYNNRYCVDQKYVSPNVKFVKMWKDVFINSYQKANTKFYGVHEFTIFKSIFGLK